MKRILWIVAIVAVIAVIVNDGGRYGNAIIELDSSTNEVLDAMSLAGKRLPPDQLATQLANQAKARDIRITQYALADNSIHIWAEKNVEGTWVLGPYLALAKGTPLAKAWKATFVVKDDGSESFR